MRLMALAVLLLLAGLSIGRPGSSLLHAHVPLGGTLEDQSRALAAHLRMGHVSRLWTGGANFQSLAVRPQGGVKVVSLRDDPTASLVHSVDYPPVSNATRFLDFAPGAGRLDVPTALVYAGVKPPPGEYPPRHA